MSIAMSSTHIWLNIVMAIVGGVGGFVLGWYARGAIARKRGESDVAQTGVLQIRGRRFGFSQILSVLIVVLVLALMASGTIAQSTYDKRLSCFSGYISEFQGTLRKNADITKRSQDGQLTNIRAQRDFLQASSSGTPDSKAFRGYVDSLNSYERSVVALQTERAPYPVDPNCEEQ